MVYYPDEFGYWANAAEWVGYDWSNLTALNSYYSFGYSLLLAPILWIWQGGVSAYRAAIALNAALQAAAVFPLYAIVRELFTESEEQERACAVGIALFYPVWLFYGQATLTEGLLFFLYILIVYLMVCVACRPRLGTIALLMCMLLYLCFVHMRTVGVAAAAVLVLLCQLWSKPAYRSRMLMVCAALLAGLALGGGIRFTLLHSVYANTDSEMLARTDIAGQFARVLAVCSKEGFARFFCGCVGKFFYLGASSFGLLYYALAYAAAGSRSVCYKLRRKMPVSAAEWTGLFLLLSFLGQFLVAAFYMNNPRRLDEIVYGRYNDYLLPLCMAIGFMRMWKSGRLVRNTAGIIAVQFLMFPAVLYAERLYGGHEIQGYFMAGISYLVDDLHFDIVSDMAVVFLFSNLIILLFSLCVWISGRKNLTVSFLALAVLAEIVMGSVLDHKYTEKFHNLLYKELQISDYIDRKDRNAPITYLYGDGITYIDNVQFNLPDKEIVVIGEEEFNAWWAAVKENGSAVDGAVDIDGYLIIDIDSAYREQIEQYQKPCVESAYLVLYDMKSFS
ncbi:MAG: hypothetical protein NC231_06525 [Bacillus sp. (in: Bacteria)]|nr:hypothetical protein [Bacillus sp. (in: firmicutes)]MCM1426744.1 hypothetical protein [Eubacterium sp.]